MKLKSILAATILLMPLSALAIELSEVSVGEVVCIDTLGPFNVVGEVVSKSSSQVRVRNHKGKEKWYDGDKLRTVMLCKITGAAAEYLGEKGLEHMADQ